MGYPMRVDPHLGDYVRVDSVPDAWEGSGESEEDRRSLVGHVGLVVEVAPGWEGCEGMALVRFPLAFTERRTGQRNIEFEALVVVSSPARLPSSVHQG
jgi:hypothetical protein